MKVGPVHVIRDATFRRLHEMQDLWGRFSGLVTDAARAGNPLADLVLEHTSGMMHSPLCCRMAATAFTRTPEPDAAGAAAARRVIAAYHRARADAAAPPAPSLWDAIAADKRDFLAALDRADVPAVQHALDRMFVTELTWGLGQVHPSHLPLLRAESSWLHFRFTDALVSLAEAVGACRVTAMSQDVPDHLQPLNRDPNAVYEAAVARLGFDPSFPAVGSAYGFRVTGRLVTIDGLTHAYAAHRLAQLGAAGPAATVYELGGGYGCLALLARRAGVGRYAVFDLPWVNVLQGYFLIRALPEGAVRLYGEDEPVSPGADGTEAASRPTNGSLPGPPLTPTPLPKGERGTIHLLPYWKLYDEPAGACDVLVNSDSLPEMGRETAAGYLPHIRRVVRRAFLSINQEAKAAVPGVGEQNCVRELIDAVGGFVCRSRQRHWVRPGYVEEVYEPVPG